MKITSPMFLQSASGKREESVEMIFENGNPTITSISTDGPITVESIYQGLPKAVKYNQITESELAIQADENTVIKIKGIVKSLNI